MYVSDIEPVSSIEICANPRYQNQYRNQKIWIGASVVANDIIITLKSISQHCQHTVLFS